MPPDSGDVLHALGADVEFSEVVAARAEVLAEVGYVWFFGGVVFGVC